MEYTSPVFHDSLTQYLSDDLESIQRRAMKIIFPGITYAENEKAGTSQKIFQEIVI
jgi:bacterioferritin (cytochrome b1)